ncbi:MAG: class I SAM-dependent methyltransferase [Planctomycetota bacterium]
MKPIRRVTKIRKLVRHLNKGYGWLRSVDQQRPFGPDGGPIPWLNYGAFRFLDSFEWNGARIGECGSGWSSMWWLARGASVESIEEIAGWADEVERMAGAARKRLRIHRCATREQSDAALAGFAASVDVLVIDGSWRTACAELAVRHVRPETLVVVDNSDWYRRAAQVFRDAGRFEIPFEGVGPCTDIFTRTSFFVGSLEALRARPRRAMGVTPAGRLHELE